MDTLFSDFELTATRLAELLALPVDQYGDKVEEWFREDQRPVNRRNYYRRTKTAIDALHRRAVRIEDLRSKVDEWRLEEMATSGQCERDGLKNNIRATTQYLDQHGEREMVVLDRRKFEPVVAGIRVVVFPHMSVLTDAMPQQLWIECSTDLRETILIARCHVTLWAARFVKQPVGQVEVVHSAMKRIVARGTVPRTFSTDVDTACEVVHRCMKRLNRSQELRR